MRATAADSARARFFAAPGHLTVTVISRRLSAVSSCPSNGNQSASSPSPATRSGAGTLRAVENCWASSTTARSSRWSVWGELSTFAISVRRRARNEHWGIALLPVDCAAETLAGATPSACATTARACDRQTPGRLAAAGCLVVVAGACLEPPPQPARSARAQRRAAVLGLEADGVAGAVPAGWPGAAPARSATRRGAMNLGGTVTEAGVEAKAGDHDEGVTRVRVNGNPLALAGVAPAHEVARVERRVQETGAV